MRRWQLALLIAASAFLLGAMFIVNLRFAQQNPGGFDFSARWVGTRLYLTQRESPYSPATTAAIQEMAYGRPAEEGEDQALFAYPFYSMLVFAPFALIPEYETARALWMTFEQAAILITAALAVNLSGWRPGRGDLLAFLLFGMFWYNGMRALIDGNVSIVVAAFATGALLAMRAGRDLLAGFLLGLATIKPQMVVLLIPFVLLWAVSRGRRQVLGGFAITMVLFLGISFLLQRDWFVNMLAQVLLYGSYTAPGTLPAVLQFWHGDKGRIVGYILNAAFGLLLVFEWWQATRKDFDWFLWTASFTVAVAFLIGLPSTSSNYVLLFPIFAWIFALLQRRLGESSQRVIWATLAIIFAAPWALFLGTMQEQLQVNEHLIMLFPVPVIVMLFLYWQRWWVVPARPAP